jgi:hypothetical protein
MRLIFFIALCMGTGGYALAQEQVSIRAFGTVGYSIMSDSKGGEVFDQSTLSYKKSATTRYWGVNKRGTFIRDTRFGLNINAPLPEDISMSAQIYAEGADQSTGAPAQFRSKVTLFVLQKEVLADWHVVIGTFPAPLWLISEQRFVGFTYPFIRPPGEIFSLGRGETMGGFLTYRNFYWGKWTLRPRFAYGTYANSAQENPEAHVDMEIMAQLHNLQIEYENILISASYNLMRGDVEQDVTRITTEKGMETKQVLANHLFLNGSYLAAGIRAEFEHFYLMTEVAHLQADYPVQSGVLAPREGGKVDSRAAFAVVGVPLGKWFPRLGVAWRDESQKLASDALEKAMRIFVTDNPDIPEAQKPVARQVLRVKGEQVVRDLMKTDMKQMSYNVGLNYQWSDKVVLKSEFERVIAAKEDPYAWGLFGIKRGSTVDMINLALDFIY